MIMKQKTYKLQKLEKNRFSILTDNMDECYMCSNNKVDIHEIYAGSNRKTSMENGFCVPLCREHHKLLQYDIVFGNQMKRICQLQFEKTGTREQFIKLIGKNYL